MLYIYPSPRRRRRRVASSSSRNADDARAPTRQKKYLHRGHFLRRSVGSDQT
jgi:hypothetical protein